MDINRNRVIFLLQKDTLYPLILLVFCLLAYGPFIPSLGFYWDDLPWIWYIHLDGPAGALEIDAQHRPLAGEILWLGALLAGDNPLGWQIFNLVLRWLSGVSFWWMARQIWPDRKELAHLAAILIVLYPGFSQQYISVNSSRHIFPLITFFASFAFTIIAIRSASKKVVFTVTAWVLSLMTMLTTEYFYGLEFVRGIVIWLVLASETDQLKRLKQTLLLWLPFLALHIAILYWRYMVSLETNYAVNLPPIAQSPMESIYSLLQTVLQDIFTTTILAWQKLFLFPDPVSYGTLKTGLFLGVVFVSFLLALLSLQKISQDTTGQKSSGFSPLFLGMVTLLLSSLLFSVTRLDVRDTFPKDRLSLSFMMGASLIAANILERIPSRGWRLLISAVFIGLSAGVHFQNGASYRDEWRKQIALFQQLSWRIPQLAPNTALISFELPIDYASDNSMTAPLNWLYAPDYDGTTSLPYIFLNIEIRLGGKLPALEEGHPLEITSYRTPFLGSTDHMLFIHFDPPGCVRVLNPETDRYLPRTSDVFEEAMLLSNLSLIDPNAKDASLPLYGPPERDSWCYYFEKAELARQQKQWDEIVSLGEIAFNLPDSPAEASERVPFIEAYARTGNWQRALELTLETHEIDKFTDDLLCDTWKRIIVDTHPSGEGEAAFSELQPLLTC